eukprot:760578-Hanusia_phi.AAC.6
MTRLPPPTLRTSRAACAASAMPPDCAPQQDFLLGVAATVRSFLLLGWCRSLLLELDMEEGEEQQGQRLHGGRDRHEIPRLQEDVQLQLGANLQGLVHQKCLLSGGAPNSTSPRISRQQVGGQDGREQVRGMRGQEGKERAPIADIQLELLDDDGPARAEK